MSTRDAAHACAAAVLSIFLLCGCGNNPQTLAIGSPCTASSQCGSDPAFFCDKEHPGGYCKRDCKADAECPAGSICAFDGAVGACHKTCNSVADCRAAEGYECKPASTDPDSKASHAFCDAEEPMDGGASD